MSEEIPNNNETRYEHKSLIDQGPKTPEDSPEFNKILDKAVHVWEEIENTDDKKLNNLNTSRKFADELIITYAIMPTAEGLWPCHHAYFSIKDLAEISVFSDIEPIRDAYRIPAIAAHIVRMETYLASTSNTEQDKEKYEMFLNKLKHINKTLAASVASI